GEDLERRRRTHSPPPPRPPNRLRTTDSTTLTSRSSPATLSLRRLRAGGGIDRRPVPETRRVRLGTTRRRDLVPVQCQVLPSGIRRDPTLWGSIEEAQPEQVRLVHVLDGLDFLGEDRGQRGDAHRPRLELLDDRREQLAIGDVKAFVVDVHR